MVYAERCSKENDWYKYEVQAYYIVDGKKVVFGRSLQLHAATKGSKKYANPVAVRIAGSKKRTLKVGKISKIKARVILPKKKFSSSIVMGSDIQNNQPVVWSDAMQSTQ